VRVTLLGPVGVESAGAVVALGGPKQRAVFALLALDVATPVLAADALPRFQMQAALDAPGGAQLQRGDYAAATQSLQNADTKLQAAVWRQLGEHASTSRNVNMLTKLLAKMDA